jgi:signal transduction histidine kinase
MLANFLSNAVEYSPNDGEVSISAIASNNATITLHVANTVVDLAPADLPHIFDRFWRKTTARTSSLRAGLGLSISQAVCRMLDVPIRAEIRDPKTFLISVALPREDAISNTSAAESTLLSCQDGFGRE